MQKLLGAPLAVTVIAVTVFFTRLGGPPLWDEDEPRNAGCAAEMMDRGDWVVPVFNDQLRPHKPALLYWLMMTAYATMGVNEFSARFWSAALGVGTVLLTYLIGRRLFDRTGAFWSAAVLATMLMFGVAARAATPDSVLIFLSTLALLIYVYGSWRPADPADEGGAPQLIAGGFPADVGITAAMYAVMGLAVLDKGPVGCVLPTAVIGMFLLIKRLPPVNDDAEASRRSGVLMALRRIVRVFHPGHFLRTCGAMKPLVAIAAILLVAAPWYVWVTLRTDGAWTYGFFIEHNLGRALEPMEHHSGPFFYYVLAMMFGTFPWSILLVPAGIDLVRRLRAGDRRRDARIFALCWAGVYLGLFSLASTKLPSYITPAYPGVALLFGDYVSRLGRGLAHVSRGWLRASFAVLITVGAGIIIGVPLAAAKFLPSEQVVAVIGLIPVTGGILAWRWLETNQPARSMKSLLVTSLLFLTAVFGVAADRVGRHQRFNDIVSQLQSRSERPVLAAYGDFRSSWVFYAQQPIQQFGAGAGPDAAKFLAADHTHCLLTSRSRLSSLDRKLPDSVTVLAEASWFLKDDTLVLLGTSSDTASQVASGSTETITR